MIATIIKSAAGLFLNPYSLFVRNTDGIHFVGDYKTAKQAHRRAQQLKATEIRWIG